MPLRIAALASAVLCTSFTTALAQQGSTINLPSSKQVESTLPGAPTKTNSLPMSMALSPDGRYAATLNGGYGVAESNYDESVLVVDLQTGQQLDFPDARTAPRSSHQTLYQGLVWSRDGKHLYASLASLTAPEGGVPDSTGNAIAVYSFTDGKLTPERLISVPLQPLAAGKQQTVFERPSAQPKQPMQGKAIPYPSGLAIVPAPGGAAGELLLVADNLSDDVLLLDPATGKTLKRFDLSTSKSVPAAYPITVTATRDGRRAFVALWNDSAVAELDLTAPGSTGVVAGRVALLGPRTPVSPGSHPAALALSPDEKQLYVALANRDMVAAIDLSPKSKQPLRVAAYFDTKLPGQTYFGAVPDALALSPDGKRLFVANGSSDAIAVYDTHGKHSIAKALKDDSGIARNNDLEAARPLGFIPTGWYPTALTATPTELLIATAKGQGTGPNNMPQRNAPAGNTRRDRTYIGTLLYGSFARVSLASLDKQLPELTAQVVTDNRLKAAEEKIDFHGGTNPIRHIIYIIKENRTYDQILGDEPAANGDPKLVMYGRSVTPNEHKLAEQFGILDNFYDSAEVSGDGHVWSNAAITSDYTEKTWQQSYRGGERAYDFEGVVSGGYPLLQGIPDVNEPASGYLWSNLAAHGKTLYHFGEYISTTFCVEQAPVAKQQSPTEGTPEPTTTGCPRAAIHKGEAIPENYGGGPSPYPWAIPFIATNTATKPELQGHFDPAFPDFQITFPDQLRVEEFLTKFKGWVAARDAGKDTMPDFIQLRLPNDHTAGTRPGMPRPAASVADNDLAVGRAVEAISHSAYWDDTAFFILEDDAQDGADHVDAHRSISLVISRYAPRPQGGRPFVDHRFYTTVSTIRTMESLLGLPPMNNNDAFAPLMSPLFAGDGDQPPYTADTSNRDNGLIYQANAEHAPGARASARMDFSHPDQAPAAELNAILWRDAKGNEPLPAQLQHPGKHTVKKDDDD